MLHVKCTKRQNLGMDDAHAMRLLPQTKCGLAGVVDMYVSHVLHTSTCDALSIELWKQMQAEDGQKYVRATLRKGLRKCTGKVCAT